MRGLLAVCAVVALAPLPASCAAPGWAFLARFAGDAELTQDVALHVAAWERLAGPAVIAVEALAAAPGQTGLGRRRWCRRGADRAPQVTDAPGGPAPLSDLAGFLEWSLPSATDGPCLLALMGHGTAPSWGDPPRGDGWRIFGRRGAGAGLSARQLGDAIRRGLERSGRRRLQVLVLEACSGASVEVLAELYDCADYVLAVPGEVVSPGIRWELPPHAGDLDAEGLVWGLVRGQAPWGSDPGSPAWSLGACDMARLPALVQAVEDLSAAALREPATFCAAARRADARGAVGERLQEVCDLGDLATGLRAYAQSPELERAADALGAAARALVVGRTVVGGGTAEVRDQVVRRAGVTIALPPVTAGGVGGYLQETPFARATGWGRLLEVYLDRSRATSPFMP